MQRIDIKQLTKIKPGTNSIKVQVGEREYRIELLYQKVQYGEKRYFQCPHCGKRIQYLYVGERKVGCSKCLNHNPYCGIQNCTKGGYDEIAYRMKRYANKYDIQFQFPFDYLDYAQDERVNKNDFRKHLVILQSLENMRCNALHLNEKYEAKLLKQVVQCKHPLMLGGATLEDLRSNFYDWEIYGGK